MSLSREHCRARLEEMAQARITARTVQARRDAAVALIESQGSATAEEVDARLAETFTPPSRAELADQVARKAASGAEHAQYRLAAAEEALAAARHKADRLATAAQAAQDAAADAEAAVSETRHAATDAAELADYAATLGDPGQDSPEPPAGAAADAATVESEG